MSSSPSPVPSSEVVAALVAILRPLKGTGEPYYTDEDHPDRVGPDEPIREAVKAALAALEVDGSGGCSLCLS